MIVGQIMWAIVAILLFVWGCFLFVHWCVHLSMSKRELRDSGTGYTPYGGWLSFQTFLKMFFEHTWLLDSYFPYSFFDSEKSRLGNREVGYVHANIIILHGKCYKLLPWSYTLFYFWQKRTWREAKKGNVLVVVGTRPYI